jgi:hypothetical protein
VEPAAGRIEVNLGFLALAEEPGEGEDDPPPGRAP